MHERSFSFEHREQSPLASNFAVLSPLEYLQDFRRETLNAQKRVWIRGRHINSDHVGLALEGILHTASIRGLNTRVHVDHTTLIEKARIRNNGTKVTLTNPPKTLFGRLLPLQGRNHMEMAIVDDISYVGGIDFEDQGLNCPDFMVKITDPAITAALADQLLQANGQKPKNDHMIDFGETQFLVGSGKKGESIIVDRAIQMVNNAQEIIQTTSWLIPDGRYLQALLKAHHRGVEIDSWISDPASLSSMPIRLVHALSRTHKGHLPIKHYPGTIHAELLITDNNQVMFGFHNLLEAGFKARVPEDAIQSRNPTLVENLKTHFDKLVNPMLLNFFWQKD